MAKERRSSIQDGRGTWGRLVLLVIASQAFIFAPSADAGPLNFGNCGNGSACPYVTYGDAESYSLGLNALLWNHYQGGGTGPGNPFYVTSTPGAIKNLIVPATGASGGPVNTNFPGMDNAYPTPNETAGTVFFTTNKTAYPGLPITGVSAPQDPSPTGTWDTADTWDTSISALSNFLGSGNTPIFFFNNNQVNSGAATNQDLAIWAQISVTSSTGAPTKYFDLTNNGGAFTEPGGGIPSTVNPTAYSSYTSTGAGPNAGTNSATDYVLSGGQICMNASFSYVACDGSQGTVAYRVNNNLGADQAAYAVVVPELNALLASPDITNYNAIHLDLRMGCDPNTVGYAGGTGANCVGRSLNNGYEQVFIASTAGSHSIPEPSTIALIGLGLIGTRLVRRRRA